MKQIYDFSEYDYLRPAHDENKRILKYFDTLCNNHGWKYFLSYGTLLGAARHQDCIPWDDDIDVVMPRADYDQLILYYLNHGIAGYKVSCYETDNVGNNLFMKFVSLNSPESLKNYQTHPEGMSIDVFPLDEAGAPNDKKQAKINRSIKRYYLAITVKERLESKAYKDSLIGRIKKRAYLLMFPGKSLKDLIGLTISKCKGNADRKLNFYANYCTRYSMEKETTPKAYWLSTTSLPLGDTSFPVPIEYKKILTQLYGTSWHELPPDRLRYRHTEYEHGFWKVNKDN